MSSLPKISLACAACVLSGAAHSAITSFNDTGAVVGGGTSIDSSYYDPNNASARSQDIVHLINFYADSSVAWEVGQWYTLWEAGGGGAGSTVVWRPTVIGANAALGPGTNHITSSQVAFMAGGGNDEPVVVDLNYTYSSANLTIVAAHDRDSTVVGVADLNDPAGGNDDTDTNYLIVSGDRTEFTSFSQALNSGAESNTSNLWNGGDPGGVGISNNGNVQGGATVGGLGSYAANGAGAADDGHVPAAAFPGLNYQGLQNTDAANGDAALPLDFSNVLDQSDPTFAFGLITALTVPEPSRAVLLLLGLGTLLLRRRR